MEKYLKDNLTFLRAIDTKSLEDNILYQLTSLNADDYNTSQKEIYYQLNNLYEKMRVLEDVVGYLKTSIKNKVAESSALCESLLKEIEESRDAIKETTYHNLYVNLQPSESTVDRDGTLIPAALMSNKEIVTKYHVKQSIPYVSEVKTFKNAYKNNPDALQKNEIYRSYYITDQSYSDGITEEITCSFSRLTPVNCVLVKSESSIFNYRLYDLKDTITINDLNWSNAINADKCSFAINTKTYKEKSYLCDMDRLAPDALTLLNTEIYKEVIGEETMAQDDIDTLLGITALKADYQKYLAQVESWYERRKDVVDENRTRGYDDEVPEHELVKLPESLGVDAETMTDGIVNETIDTSNLMPTLHPLEKENNEQRIIHMYSAMDKIYPSYERYRFDYLNPNNDRYYQKLNSIRQ